MSSKNALYLGMSAHSRATNLSLKGFRHHLRRRTTSSGSSTKPHRVQLHRLPLERSIQRSLLQQPFVVVAAVAESAAIAVASSRLVVELNLGVGAIVLAPFPRLSAAA